MSMAWPLAIAVEKSLTQNTSMESSPAESSRFSCWVWLAYSIMMNSTLAPIFSRVMALTASSTMATSLGTVRQDIITLMVG